MDQAFRLLWVGLSLASTRRSNIGSTTEEYLHSTWTACYRVALPHDRIVVSFALIRLALFFETYWNPGALTLQRSRWLLSSQLVQDSQPHEVRRLLLRSNDDRPASSTASLAARHAAVPGAYQTTPDRASMPPAFPPTVFLFRGSRRRLLPFVRQCVLERSSRR